MSDWSRKCLLATLIALPSCKTWWIHEARVGKGLDIYEIRASAENVVTGYRYAFEKGKWVVHKGPLKKPDVFRPERFEKEKLAALPELAYLPFGAGPRACIGKSFATMEARLVLATLAQRHRLSLAKGKRVVAQPQITLMPKNGIPMKIANRSPHFTKAPITMKST